jgi:hypothetical protein
MKILKAISVYTLCAMLVCMPMSCVGPMGTAQGNALKTEISAQIEAGEVSEELGLFLIAEINKRMDPNYSGGIDWDAILKSGGGILLAAVSAYTGVRITRGPAKPMDKSNAGILDDLVAEFKAKKEEGEPSA